MQQDILVQKKVTQAQNPTDFATSFDDFYSKKSTSQVKKNIGQFFTPKAVAKFLAESVVLDNNIEEVSILDPGAGLGILSCAIVEEISQKYKNIKSIKLHLYELDKPITPYLVEVLNNLEGWCSSKSISLTFELIEKDFLKSNIYSKNDFKYDIIISNPPYFKLSKKYKSEFDLDIDLQSVPNAYSAFLIISERLLKAKGQLLFITPRSFSSGKYFNYFRRRFFNKMVLKWVHVFEKRTSAFKKDKVLQEVIIFRAIKRNNDFEGEVCITNSSGIHDFNLTTNIVCKESLIIDFSSNEMFLFLPTTKKNIDLLKQYNKLINTLSTLNIKASTGPVVYFRNYDFLRVIHNTEYIPLIWLNNVNIMNLDWPNDNILKPQYFKVTEKSKSVLLESKNYVLIRRFSAKGDKKRLIACHILKNSPNGLIGLENKLNYLEKINDELTEEEAIGLSAVLCSDIYNQLFSMLNGNTNVSVSELHALYMPDLDTISNLGTYLKDEGVNEENINKQVSILFEKL